MVAFNNGILGLALAMGATIIVGLASAGPAFVPPESPTSLIPPWFAFNIGCKLHSFFSYMAFATQPPDAYIMDLSTAYWNSEVAYALTENKILDTVQRETAATGGTISCEAVADKLDLQAFVVCRYMESGMYLHLLDKDGATKEYSITPHGALLTDTGDLRDFMLMINRESVGAFRAITTDLMKDGGKPGRNSGWEISTGMDVWKYYSKYPEKEAVFAGAMKSLNPVATGALLSDWVPPSKDAKICDIGGGVGSLAAEILVHYPEMTGIVFDRPEIAPLAKEHLESMGVDDRAEAVGGNFFEEFPEIMSDCDAFILRYIVHDWDDESNVKILSNIRKVAENKKDGKTVVVVMDQVLETGAESFFEKAKTLMSINMISCNPYGARERTVEEHEDLFEASGYEHKPKVIPLRTIHSLVEVEI